MKYSQERMSDPAVQINKIGEDLKRSKRNEWGNSVEELIRAHSPYPITYDVNCLQGRNFTEYSYTELVGGMLIKTQSADINTRLIHFCAGQKSSVDVLDQWESIIADKYDLNSDLPDLYSDIEDIVFLPGDNLSDLINRDNLHRLLHENPKAMIKPHPISNDAHMMSLYRDYGANRIIPAHLSGLKLLKNAKRIFTSSASELGIVATILGKEIYNIGMFRYEAIGTYYMITRVLFLAEDKRQALANIVNCVWSGCIFPWQDNIEERIGSYYQSTLEMKDEFKALNGPIIVPESLKKHTQIRAEMMAKKEKEGK